MKAVPAARDIDGRPIAALVVCLAAMLAVAGWLLAGWRAPAAEPPAATAARDLRECVDRLAAMTGADSKASEDLARDCRLKRAAYEAATRDARPAGPR